MKAFITKGVFPATLLTLATSVVASPVSHPAADVQTDPPAINKWSKWYDAYEIDGYEYRYAITTPPDGKDFMPAPARAGIGKRYAPDEAYRPLMIRLGYGRFLMNTWSKELAEESLKMVNLDLESGQQTFLKNMAGADKNPGFFPYFYYQPDVNNSVAIVGCQPLNQTLVFDSYCRFEAATMRLKGLEYSIEVEKQVPPKYALKSSTDIIAEGKHYALVFEGGGEKDNNGQTFDFYQSLVHKTGSDPSQWEVLESFSNNANPGFKTDETYRHVMIGKYCDLDIEDYSKACIDFPPVYTDDMKFVGFNAKLRQYLVQYPDPENPKSSSCLFLADFDAELVQKPADCVIKMPAESDLKKAGISDDRNIAYVIQDKNPHLYVAFKLSDGKWSSFRYLNQATVELIKNKEVPYGYIFQVDDIRLNENDEWEVSGSVQSSYAADKMDKNGLITRGSQLRSEVGNTVDRKGFVVTIRKKQVDLE